MALYEVALGFIGGENVNFLKYLCGSHMVFAGVSPHLTIARFDAEDEREMVRRFLAFAPRVRGQKLEFTSIDLLPGGKLTIECSIMVRLREQCAMADRELGKYFVSVHLPILSYDHSSWLPHVVVGEKLTPGDRREYLGYFMKRFKPFKSYAGRVMLIRQEPYEELVSLIVKDDGQESFAMLRPGMNSGEVASLLGREVDVRRVDTGYVVYDLAEFPEKVMLFFKPRTGRLYSIRFDLGHPGSIMGIHVGDRMSEIRRVLGEPSRVGGCGQLGSDVMWFYDELIPGATLRIDGFSAQDRSMVIFIC